MAEDAGRDALDVMASCDRYAQWLYDLARPHLGSRVVEAGAGIGTMSARMAADVVARDVLLTDADSSRVGELRKRFADRPRITCDPWRLPEPFPTTDFRPDTFVLWNVLEHIEDDVRALAEMARALAGGGTLVVLTPAEKGLMGAFDRRIGHHRRYGRRELSAKARAVGLTPVVERPVNLVGLVGWLFSVKFMRARRLRSGNARAFDRLVPLVRLWEDRLPVPFGLSVMMVARKG
jgi:SAM-dependent methyltransferase